MYMWLMSLSHQRHDLTDHQWGLLEPHLPGRAGMWGGVAQDNRRFINGVIWLLRTGAPVRDLPPEYGGWSNTHRRFCRWRDKGIWEKLLEIFIDDPDFEWLMIDATHCKVHQQGTGARGGNQAIGRTKGGATQRYIWPWMRMVCRSERLLRQLPKRYCCHAQALIEGFEAEHLIADKGYDSDAIVQQATKQGMQPQIPPRSNRKNQRPYDKHLYRQRHLIENAFAHLKQWRGIATRYAKTAASFAAAINIRCLFLWLNIS